MSDIGPTQCDSRSDPCSLCHGRGQRSIEQPATGERHNTTCPQCKGAGSEAMEILVRFDKHRRFLGFASMEGS